MIRKASVCVVVVMLATLVATGPAEAGAPQSPVFGARGSRREVAFLDDGRLLLQRLGTDGTAQGARIPVASASEDRSFQAPIWITLVDTGTFVTVGDSHVDQTGAFLTGQRTFFVPRDGTAPTSSHQSCPMPEEGDRDPSPAATASNGHVLVVAGYCDDAVQPGLFVSTVDGSVRNRIPGSLGAHPEDLAVAAVPGGGFLVTWLRAGSGSDYDIVATRADATGRLVGTIAIATGPADQFGPAVAASGGTFLIAWKEDFNGDIFGRAVAPAGVGARTTLVDLARSFHPQLTAAPDAGWHLAWDDVRLSERDIYIARISSSLAHSPTGGRIAAGGPGTQRHATLARTSGGAAVLFYVDAGRRYLRDITAAGTPTGTPHHVTFSPK